MNNTKRIVIIGGVAAGASCATRLRRLNETYEIVIIEKVLMFHLQIVGCLILLVM